MRFVSNIIAKIRAKPRNASGPPDWTDALSDEIAFWRQIIATQGGAWPDSWRKNLTPGRQLEAQFRALIDAAPGATVRILDVGAGPVTPLAVEWEERTVITSAVDPLADEYNRLLEQYGVRPLVRTQFGEAERLDQLFPENTFDLVYASNCLDHSYDPIEAIRQMVAVAKRGCYVMLEHATNEAEFMKYQGLHQWNFAIENGEFVVWRPAERAVVRHVVDRASIDFTVYPMDTGREWLSVRLKKHVET